MGRGGKATTDYVFSIQCSLEYNAALFKSHYSSVQSIHTIHLYTYLNSLCEIDYKSLMAKQILVYVIVTCNCIYSVYIYTYIYGSL